MDHQIEPKNKWKSRFGEKKNLKRNSSPVKQYENGQPDLFS